MTENFEGKFNPEQDKAEEQKDIKIERASGISGIVGDKFSDDGEMARFEELFGDQQKLKIEREKSEEETELIEEIIQHLPEFLKKYGVEVLGVTPAHVHLVDSEHFTPEEREKYLANISRGFYIPEKQKIVVFSANLYEMAKTIVHEFLHLHAFTSYTAKDGSLIHRRIGLSIFTKDGEKSYLTNINEALIEELVMRFVREHFGNIEVLNKRRWNTLREFDLDRSFNLPEPKSIKQKSEVNSFARANNPFVEMLYQKNYASRRPSLEHGKAFLTEITEQILKDNPDKFSSTEEVIDFFAKASFSGHLLEIGRVIEKSFGKGSFRAYAEETSTDKISPPELEIAEDKIDI